MNIHPTAIVSNKAKLGSNIQVAAYAIIHDDVEIGDNCTIGPHAVIYDGARIGNNVKIHQSAAIANIPQDLKFAGEKSIFEVGDNTTIREFVTLNRGTVATGVSRVGKNCLIMAYTHVGHDCKVGNHCIIANSVQIGGHVVLEDWAFIGGSTPIHQFCRVGQHVMIGGGFKISVDVPPYILGASEPLRYSGLNTIGLRRRGFSNEEINSIKSAYHVIYNSGLNFSQAKARLIEEMSDNPLVMNIVEFMNNSKRSLIRK
ncbi:MAG: acyl-[acyl-carrier-protein]--UDP-N-acetylglucosamine O-acyltransferase [Ignavibacteria bacterium RBG_13_36_8]|nr:MAG: acyl-[acyl-carrier-protein]--UDP-N-acetylglucosamine O-acyltransferase [Ignavibacteria bacterium RBG_13_36_8]